MLHGHWLRHAFASILVIACAPLGAAGFVHPDHYEFDATLDAPFRATAGQRSIVLRFDYPTAGDLTAAAWELQAIAPDGRVVRSWSGITPLRERRARAVVDWNGRDQDGRRLGAGFYGLRLRAAPTVLLASDGMRSASDRVADAFSAFADEVDEQRVDVILGNVAPARMPRFDALRVGAEGAGTTALAQADARAAAVPVSGLPYTIYYGNLHSQTNHSDGGGNLATCSSAESPQSGQYGPADAYTMMRTQAGGDFLLASEHNHMYDGSTGTNASANPATAIALFDSGLQAASGYRNANPDFMALYGLEWGVISNGGHLNLINPDALPTWERNGSGQLIGEVDTPKSNYPAMYATMQQRGWIGQFNHPSTSGQFLVNGTALGYDANGAQVMALAEILNTSAFSTNTTQTETSRSSYAAAWNKLLEAGYKVAPTSNQDNHCANWGLSFSNRTGVLLPSATALGTTAFFDALRARRTFATEDKAGQLVLTGNGRIMGEAFANSGPLTLTANYASSNGQSVQRVQFFEGVPGRNGTVTQLAEGSGSLTLTPTTGEHFYYALVTQANGLRLWSAPVWVSQGTGTPTDTIAPTVSASSSGSAGTINFSANASDNVGVTRVEFYVDGTLQGSDTNAPYSVAFDSTTVANGSHTLTAKAFDAAGNVGTSSAVGFSVNNSTPPGTTFNETEANGSVSAANTVARSYSKITGTMGNTTDKDYFRLTLNAGETLRIDMTGPAGSSYDYDLYLVNGSDTTLKSSTGGTTTESLTYTNGASAQTVYAKVIAYKGSSTTQPYTLTLTYSGGGTQLVANGGFESGATGWSATSSVISNDASQAARTGSWKAWLNGYGAVRTDTLSQTVTIPSTASSASLVFWLKVTSDETTTTTAYDTLKVQVRNTAGTVLATLQTYSNLDKGSNYVQRSFDLGAYKGQTINLYFEGVEGSQVATSFLVDDVSLASQ